MEIQENQGVVFFIEYNENTPYEDMAKLALKTFKNTNPDISVAVIYTNDYKHIIADKLQNYCDYLIEIENTLDNFGKNKKISNLHNIYFYTPFKKNIYFDCDFLFTNNIQYLFKLLDKENFLFTNDCYNFRNVKKQEKCGPDFFNRYGLKYVKSNSFSFNKNKESLQFFNLWSQISAHWKMFYGDYLQSSFNSQDLQIDISLCCKLSNNEHLIKENLLYWNDVQPYRINYTDQTDTEFYKYVNLWCIEQNKFKFQNYIQSCAVHYKNFNLITPEIEEKIFDKKYA